MKVVVLASAERDLSKPAAFYLEDASANIAQAFLDEFRHATRLLAEYPEMGKAVSDGQRITLLRRFPYAVIYKTRAESITIRAVAHQRRKPSVFEAGS